jgi:hypothetical protein
MPNSYWLHVSVCITIAIAIITFLAVYGDGKLESPETWSPNMTTHEILEGSLHNRSAEQMRMDRDIL